MVNWSIGKQTNVGLLFGLAGVRWNFLKKPTNVPSHYDDIVSSATYVLEAIDKSSDLELNQQSKRVL